MVNRMVSRELEIDLESEYGHLEQITKDDDLLFKEKIKGLTTFIVKNSVQDIAIEDGKDIRVKIKGIQSTEITLDKWNRNDFNYFISNICKLRVDGRAAPRMGEVEYDPKIADVLLKINDKSYDFSVRLGNKTLRIHLFYTYAPNKASRSSIAMMIRVIDLKIPSLPDINIPEFFRNALDLQSGLMLIAGHVGDGKTTTLASLLNTLNLTSPTQMTVLTIENPIEYVYESESVYFIQREVGNNVPSFKKATDDAMRENADIVMIGELRDEGEMDNALRLAEIGKLVLATIHSNSVADTPERFVNAFSTVEKDNIRVRLKENLVGIVHQNLEVVEGRQYPKVEGVLAMDNESRRVLRESLSSREQLSDLVTKAEYDWVYNYQKSFKDILTRNTFNDEDEARRILVPKIGE